MITEAILSNFRNKFESELIDELSVHGKVFNAEAGDIVMEPGKYIKTIPLIVRGLLKIMRRDEDGHEVLLYYLHPGETCAMSLTCCVAQSKSNILAIAEENTEMILFSANKMEEWSRKYSSWSSFVMETYNKRFNEMLTAIDGIAFKKVDERLEQYLIQKSENINSKVISVSHQQVADELNTSREVVSRLLKVMENDGKIQLGRNRIELQTLIQEQY